MVITGLEIIRGNPSASQGILEAAPGEKIELAYNDKLRITASFEYRGPAQKVTLYGSIGARSVLAGFDEIISSETTVQLPETPGNFTVVNASLEIPITADIAPKPDYDIYVEIKEYPGAGKPEVDDVITIVGMLPSFKLIEEIVYPYSYVYDGKTEVNTFTFKSDPFTPSNWLKGVLASHLEDEVKKAGGRVLSLKVYIDTTPLLWSDWRLEVEGIPPKTTAGLGMAVGIVWWAIAILAALAIALIIVLTWSIKTIAASFTHKPISEDIKKAWTRKTLISAIGDFEVKLKRTPTPAEDLEKKTDDELRSYCDELAAAVAPPVSGAGMAIAILGAGILAIGVLAVGAYAMSQPREKKK